jgi:hypothetical protein
MLFLGYYLMANATTGLAGRKICGISSFTRA